MSAQKPGAWVPFGQCREVVCHAVTRAAAACARQWYFMLRWDVPWLLGWELCLVVASEHSDCFEQHVLFSKFTAIYLTFLCIIMQFEALKMPLSVFDEQLFIFDLLGISCLNFI